MYIITYITYTLHIYIIYIIMYKILLEKNPLSP